MTAFADYKIMIGDVAAKVKAGDRDGALSLLRGKGGELASINTSKIDEIYDFAEKKAKSFIQISMDTETSVRWTGIRRLFWSPSSSVEWLPSSFPHPSPDPGVGHDAIHGGNGERQFNVGNPCQNSNRRDRQTWQKPCRFSRKTSFGPGIWKMRRRLKSKNAKSVKRKSMRRQNESMSAWSPC